MAFRALACCCCTKGENLCGQPHVESMSGSTWKFGTKQVITNWPFFLCFFTSSYYGVLCIVSSTGGKHGCLFSKYICTHIFGGVFTRHSRLQQKKPTDFFGSKLPFRLSFVRFSSKRQFPLFVMSNESSSEHPIVLPIKNITFLMLW